MDDNVSSIVLNQQKGTYKFCFRVCSNGWNMKQYVLCDKSFFMISEEALKNLLSYTQTLTPGKIEFWL